MRGICREINFVGMFNERASLTFSLVWKYFCFFFVFFCFEFTQHGLCALACHRLEHANSDRPMRFQIWVEKWKVNVGDELGLLGRLLLLNYYYYYFFFRVFIFLVCFSG